MNACNCCSEPPCGDITLECESWVSSASKPLPCGHIAYDGDDGSGRRYSTATHTDVGSYTRTHTVDGCTDTRGATYDFGWSDPYTEDPCTAAKIWSGTEGCSASRSGCEADWSGAETGTYTALGGVSWVTTGGSGCGGGGGCDSGSWSWAAVVVVSATSKTQEGTYTKGSSCDSGSGSRTRTWTLSELRVPETTAELIARAEDGYPEDPTGQSCEAGRDLAEDESNIMLRKFRFRLSHPPTGTCYLRVWVDRIETPADGDPVTTAGAPYTWIGTGNPCFAAPFKASSDADNLIVGGSWTDVDPPSENGTIILRARYACVPDYVPDINNPVNGYPPL